MQHKNNLFIALNKIAPGFSYIASRPVVCGTEHAYRLPTGKCVLDLQTRVDAIGAAVGAPVELVDRGGAVIVRVVEKDFSAEIPFNMSDLRTNKLLIGYDRLLNPVYLKLMHQLIGGASGAGKTMLLRFLLFQLIRIGAIIKIVDMKGFSFFPFEQFKNVTVAKSLPEAADLLHEASIELEGREKQIILTRNRSLTQSFTPYIILIDEAAQIAPKMHSDKMKGNAKFCDEVCARISQKGRESRVNLFYCTQKPSRDIVNGQVKANVESAIAFRTNNHYESEVIIGDGGAERILISTPGRCLYRHDRLQTLQVPFIGEKDADWEALLAPLKVEVVHHGNSKRTESPRQYLDGTISGADSNDTAAGDAQRFTRSAKESLTRLTGARGRQTGSGGVSSAGKSMAPHTQREDGAERYSDEIAD